MRYGTFLQRLGSLLIDGAILSPISLLGLAFRFPGREVAATVHILLPLVGLSYNVICHAIWGQTIGKRICRIKVIKVTGESLGWPSSILRSSVDIIFDATIVSGSVIAILNLSDAQFQLINTLPIFQRITQFSSSSPVPRWIIQFSEVWFWSEVIVMLFNKQRRSVHDFIAGSLVISTSSSVGIVDGSETTSQRILSGFMTIFTILGILFILIVGSLIYVGRTLPKKNSPAASSSMAPISLAVPSPTPTGDTFTALSQDKLKIRVQVRYARYSQEAIRQIWFRIPSKDLTFDYKLNEKPIPDGAEGPFSFIQNENGDLSNRTKLPSKEVEWFRDYAKTPSAGFSSGYLTLECMREKTPYFPLAKYIFSQNASSNPIPGGYIKESVTQQLLSDFFPLPDWFVTACDEHLKSAPTNKNFIRVSAKPVINPLIAALVDPTSRLDAIAMKREIDKLFKGPNMASVLTVASPYNRNLKSRLMALIKLVEQDRLGVVQNLKDFSKQITLSSDLLSVLKPFFNSTNLQIQKRAMPFKEILLSPDTFEAKYPLCKTKYPQGISNLKISSNGYHPSCEEGQLQEPTFVKKYSLPIFCFANTELVIDSLKGKASGASENFDSCKLRNGTGASSGMCLPGYKIDVRPGLDQCVPL